MLKESVKTGPGNSYNEKFPLSKEGDEHSAVCGMLEFFAATVWMLSVTLLFTFYWYMPVVHDGLLHPGEFAHEHDTS